MAVKAGYKQTEVGVIPEEWEVRSLGCIGRVIRGSSPRPKGDKRFYGGSVPRLMVEDVTRDRKFVTPALDFLTIEGAKRSRPCKQGTLTVVCSGTPTVVGLPSILAVDACIHDGMLALVQLDRSIDPEYIFYRLTSLQEQLHASATHGGTFVNLTTTGFGAFTITLPTLLEQRTIAGVLSDADVLIGSLEQLIAKKRDLKQAAMQQLLTGKIRLPGFHGEWKVKRLGDVADVFKGAGLSKASLSASGARQCILYGELFTTYSRVIRHVVSKTNALDGRLSQSGDVLVPGSTTTEGIDLATASALLIDGVALGGDINIVRKKGEGCYDSIFLANYLMHVKKFDIAELAQGITIIHLYGRDLLDLSLQLPAHVEQTAIAEVLSDMDAELAALEQRRDKTCALKQGMMQELLTGRTRLSISASSKETPQQTGPAQSRDTRHNWAFNEAVVIAALANKFGSREYPLGRLRYTKLAYLMHRHVEGNPEGYLKKAAGPYNPATRYKGPEGIAQKNGYVRAVQFRTLSGFVSGENINQALVYFLKWYGSEVLEWLEQFRYEQNEALELLTTVDLAILDLRAAGKKTTVENIKEVLRGDPEWKPKLKREVFSDANIKRTIAKCQDVFGLESRKH